jgi:hypothetical protein
MREELLEGKKSRGGSVGAKTLNHVIYELKGTSGNSNHQVRLVAPSLDRCAVYHSG